MNFLTLFDSKINTAIFIKWSKVNYYTLQISKMIKIILKVNTIIWPLIIHLSNKIFQNFKNNLLCKKNQEMIKTIFNSFTSI